MAAHRRQGRPPVHSMILESGVGRLRKRVDRIYYGWRLVPVAGLVMLISTTPMFHAMGLWFVAMESTFGWSRTQLSLAFAFTRIEGGILGPIEGYLVDRLGTRRLVLIGLIIMGTGWLLFSQVRSLWMFYLAYVVIALGSGLGSWLPLTTMLNNWFNRRRASAMGWASASSRLGTLLLIPAIAWAIDPDFDRLGWEFTTALLGIAAILLAVPLSRMIRNNPEEYGLLPDGDAPDEVESREAERSPVSSTTATVQVDFTVRQAVRTRAFWLISLGHGFTSMLLIGLVAHLVPMMTDQGYSFQTSAFVLTGYTTVSMFFQVVGGFVGDRVPKHLAITVFVFIQAAGVILLVHGPATLPVAYGFAVLFGIGFGGRSPLTTSIRGDYFGRRSFGKIMGVSQVPMNVLLLIAPIFAGVMRDWQGDYTIAFTVLAGCSAFGGVLFLFAKRPVIR
jgi:sugar phosphate permease